MGEDDDWQRIPDLGCGCLIVEAVAIAFVAWLFIALALMAFGDVVDHLPK